MFSELIDALKTKTILTNKNVLDLRWFISNKYPDMSPKEAAKIFADSINRIIDKHLPMLNENAKPQIKTLLFEDAIKKPSFEITCADVFRCCIQTKEASDNFFEELTKWTERKTNKAISKARLTQFVRKLHLTMNDYPYKNIQDLIKIVEKDNSDMNPFASAKFSVPNFNNNKTKPSFNINNRINNGISNKTTNKNISTPFDEEETTIDHSTYSKNFNTSFNQTLNKNTLPNKNSNLTTNRTTNSLGNKNQVSFSNNSVSFNNNSDNKNQNLNNNTNSIGSTKSQTSFENGNSTSPFSTKSQTSFGNNSNSYNTKSQASFGNGNSTNSFVTNNNQSSFGNGNVTNSLANNNKTSFGNGNVTNSLANNNKTSFGNGNATNSLANNNKTSFGNGNTSNSFTAYGNGNNTNSFANNSQASYGNGNNTNSFANNSQASYGNGNNANSFANNNHTDYGNGNNTNSFANNSHADYGNGNNTNSFANNSHASYGNGNNTNSFANNSQASYNNGNNTNSFATNSQASYNGDAFSQSHSFGQSSYGRLETNSQASYESNHSEGFTHVNYNEYKPIYSFEKSSMKVFDENDESVKKKFSSFIRKVTMRKFISAIGLFAASATLYQGANMPGSGTSDSMNNNVTTLVSTSNNVKTMSSVNSDINKPITIACNKNFVETNKSKNALSTSNAFVHGKAPSVKLANLTNSRTVGHGKISSTDVVKKTFNIESTTYCACAKCCGSATGRTATGTKAKAGRTIAVNPNMIPLGTWVYVEFPAPYTHMNGKYRAEDTGSAVKSSIDVFMNSHSEALRYGRRTVKIYILK
jgi:3D (Asp-Asp-Asp) domain-containing protein